MTSCKETLHTHPRRSGKIPACSRLLVLVLVLCLGLGTGQILEDVSMPYQCGLERAPGTGYIEDVPDAGMSGGPVFDMRGNVLGMVTRKCPHTPGGEFLPFSPEVMEAINAVINAHRAATLSAPASDAVEDSP